LIEDATKKKKKRRNWSSINSWRRKEKTRGRRTTH
jgi:hypothetical protein